MSIVARPECRSAIVQGLRALMLPTFAAPGLQSCRLFRDADDDNTFCYVEEWRTVADLDRQIRSTEYTRLLALMEEAAEPPQLRLNWVTDVKGLEYLAEVRLGAAASDVGGT